MAAESARAWREAHPERVAAYNTERRRLYAEALTCSRGSVVAERRNR